MTGKEFAEGSRALFGPTWQSAISNFLEVSPRTIRRWVAGKADVPNFVVVVLRNLSDVQHHARGIR